MGKESRIRRLQRLSARTAFAFFLYLLPAGTAGAQDIDTLAFNGEHLIDLVFAAEGYRKEEHGLFLKEAERLAGYFLKTPPFNEYSGSFNVFAVFTESEESGISPQGKNTFFKVRSENFGIERLFIPEDIGLCHEFIGSIIPECDFICLCVNTEEYGGGGGEITLVSRHPLAGEILVHELGHSIGGLGDEYWCSDDFLGEFPNMALEAGKAPWAGMPGTEVYPLKRPDGSIAAYIPCLTDNDSRYCRMARLGKEFCPVCNKAISEALKRLVGVSGI